MGNIVDKAQHAADIAEMQAIVELCPVVSRHISHHARNSIAIAMGSIHLGKYDDAMAALKHLIADLEEVGL